MNDTAAPAPDIRLARHPTGMERAAAVVATGRGEPDHLTATVACSAVTTLRICRQCGRPRPIESYKLRKLTCGTCVNRRYANRRRAWQRANRDRNPVARRAAHRRANRWAARRNRDSVASANRLWRRFTDAERAVLLDGSVSHARAAALLSRSVCGVISARFRLAKRLGLPEPIRAHATQPRLYPRAEPAAAAIVSA